MSLDNFSFLFWQKIHNFNTFWGIFPKDDNSKLRQQNSKPKLKPNHDNFAQMKKQLKGNPLNADYGEMSRDYYFGSSEEDDQRIVGGKSAATGQFPYQVKIGIFIFGRIVFKAFIK